MDFRSTIRQEGKAATGIVVPEDIVAALGSRRPAVRVTVGGHTYRSTVAARGERYLIPLSAENRGLAGLSGVAAGDEVDVRVELDTEPLAVDVPADLAEGLAANAVAQEYFAGLPYSHQRAYTTWIESAKKTETRSARVGRALEMLADHQRR